MLEVIVKTSLVAIWPLMAALTVGPANAAEYYCFVKLQDGRDWFSGYVFETEVTPAELKKYVKDAGAFASDGKTVMPVASVIECIAEGEEFANGRAKQLLQEFPR